MWKEAHISGEGGGEGGGSDRASLPQLSLQAHQSISNQARESFLHSAQDQPSPLSLKMEKIGLLRLV